MEEKILLCLAHMSGNEMKYIQEAFEDNWVAPLGPNVDGFEKDLEQFIGCNKRIVALSAGTAAIHLALVMLGVSHGDEVLCQSFTFAASANPIVYQGATPIFIDSESDSWNMSPVLLEKAIVDRKNKTGKYPKAIIVVHLYGMPANMDEITRIAQKYEIPIVEDAAEALGSQFNDKPCGTFGEYGVLSFNGNKMITTSGGGALIVNDEQTKKLATYYATQAREQVAYYQHNNVGYNYRMSNISAGIGRGQMSILEQHIEHHHMIHSTYKELLKNTPGITLFSNPDNKYKSNYWLCNILIDSSITGFTYEGLRIALQNNDIESRPLWKPMHLQPVFKNCPSYIDGTSESLFNKGLCIPAGPWVNKEHVKRIVEIIHNNLKQ